MTSPLNSFASSAAQQAVSKAAGGGDAVGGAMGAAAMANPAMAYGQLGVQAAQALTGLAQASSDPGPNGGGSISTPAFNNAPTAIINFGSGSISSTANPTTSNSAAQGGPDGSAKKGGLASIAEGGDYLLYAILGVVALVGIKTLKG